MSEFCSNMIDVGCYSHTVDNAGDHFTQPDIQQFLGLYHSMMCHSTKAKTKLLVSNLKVTVLSAGGLHGKSLNN